MPAVLGRGRHPRGWLQNIDRGNTSTYSFAFLVAENIRVDIQLNVAKAQNETWPRSFCNIVSHGGTSPRNLVYRGLQTRRANVFFYLCLHVHLHLQL